MLMKAIYTLVQPAIRAAQCQIVSEIGMSFSLGACSLLHSKNSIYANELT